MLPKGDEGLADHDFAYEYCWRGDFDSLEVERLHAEAFDHVVIDYDWKSQLRRSLGWVTARRDNHLVGFVNVAWDGGAHAFILDTMVATEQQRRGIATRLIDHARIQARKAGCEWLHVDFEDHLEEFYLAACGFRGTKAGLIDLKGDARG